MQNRVIFGLIFIGSIILFVQACGRKVQPEQGCNFVQNSALQRVSWGDRTPVKFYVHTSVPPKFYSAIESAVDQWNLRLGREILRIESFNMTGPPVPSRDGYNVIYFLDTWDLDKFTEQGRTTIYWTGDSIYEADIRINDKDFDFFVGDISVAQFQQVDFESLILHELGHSLGLAHNQGAESVMNASLKSASERRDPGKVDVDSLRCEY